MTTDSPANLSSRAKQLTNESRISLALGGGGARGVAHIGVIQAIQESGLQIDHVCGTSIGSLAGALCFGDSSIDEVNRRIREFIQSEAFQRRQTMLYGITPDPGSSTANSSLLLRLKKKMSFHQNAARAIRGSSVLPGSVLRHAIDALVPDIGIEDLKIPFSIIAVDLLSGQRVELQQGSLRKAVCASASIPGVFPPVAWEDKLLCDIGVYENIPVSTAKEHATDLTVAVDVSNHVVPVEKCEGLFQVYSRILQLSEYQIRCQHLSDADLVIQPSVGHRAWYDFANTEQLVLEGYEAALKAIGPKSYFAPPKSRKKEFSVGS